MDEVNGNNKKAMLTLHIYDPTDQVMNARRWAIMSQIGTLWI